MKTWTVEVVQYDGLKVVRRMSYNSERTAEAAERGVLHQLNVGEYFTRIVSSDAALQAPADAQKGGV